ncbi:hypothetical protein ACTNEO_09940 [Gracilibacillus sp. HCP3S3_G5_1]
MKQYVQETNAVVTEDDIRNWIKDNVAKEEQARLFYQLNMTLRVDSLYTCTPCYNEHIAWKKEFLEWKRRISKLLVVQSAEQALQMQKQKRHL